MRLAAALVAGALAGAVAGYLLAMRLRLRARPDLSPWAPLRDAAIDAGLDEFCRRRGARR